MRQVPVVLSALSATMTPIWVAADYGIFHRYGIDPELHMLSPATASQALSAGSAPVGVTGGSLITAWLGGASDRRFIVGLVDKARLKVLTMSPDVTRVDDLRGRSVGTTTPGSGGSLALFATLRRFNLEPDRDVTITYLRDQPTVLNTMVSGAVAAGNLPSPFSDQAEALGARLLVDMKDLNIRVALNHITSTTEHIERDPDLLRRFLMAYIEGVQFARDHPNEAIESIMKGTRQDLRPEAEAAYNLNYDLWSPWLSLEGIQLILDNSDHPAARTARAADIVDDRILRELERSGWLAAHYNGP